jgi:hypothetical protein
VISFIASLLVETTPRFFVSIESIGKNTPHSYEVFSVEMLASSHWRTKTLFQSPHVSFEVLSLEVASLGEIL